jgi:hypothetical protein
MFRIDNILLVIKAQMNVFQPLGLQNLEVVIFTLTNNSYS